MADGLDRAFEFFPRLGWRRHQVAGTFAWGELRMLSLSRVLVEEPRLLIADELSLGLAPIIVEEVYRTLESIRQSGTSLLIVEQQTTYALKLCDRIVFLKQGQVDWEGPAEGAEEVVTSRLFDHGG